MNTITKEILSTEDLDTKEKDILYSIILQPRIGFIQLSTNDGKKISNFTQSKFLKKF